ncbi:MAG: adenylate/guanylate cyclase domain-containing protein [Amylibacter sp.]
MAFCASLGVVKVEVHEVSGVQENWMQLVRGEAIDLACRADAFGKGGTVVLSEDCAKHLSAFEPDLSPLVGGYKRLNSLGKSTTHVALPLLEVNAEQEKSLGLCLTEVVHRHLYYPSSAVTAEFRKITVLFADISVASPEALHGAVQAAQKKVSHFEGVVYQLLEDDKGTGLIIVFGLPGTSHDDDHLRALLLSKQLCSTFEALGISPRLGIATGTAFCGPLGTDERQQYSIIGSTVNLAARFMTLAGKGETYCDNQTYKLASGEFEFEEAGWTVPKGFLEPVAIFKPGDRYDRVDNLSSDVDLVGREAELNLIVGHINGVTSGGASKLLLIRAEAGVGKSALLQKVRSIIINKGLMPITGSADAFEKGTAYFAFLLLGCRMRFVRACRLHAVGFRRGLRQFGPCSSVDERCL